VRHPPLLALYIAAGLKGRGFAPEVLDLYHTGSDWHRRLARLGGGHPVVVVMRDYDRPLPMRSLVDTVGFCGDHLQSPAILVAGTADEQESRTILARLPGVAACFPRFPEEFIPAWLVGETSRGGIVVRDSPYLAPDPVDLDSLPWPAWELVDHTFYAGGASHRFRYRPCLPVLAIRGCPYHCVFCDKASFCTGRDVVHRRPAAVCEEIGYLQDRFGVREVQFAEPLFVISREWVLEMCDRLRRLTPPVAWSCHVRVDLVDPPLLETMVAAGCWNVLFGVESGADRVRAAAGKSWPLEQAGQVINAARRLGLETTASFVLGLPGDTPETVRETLAAARRLDPDYAQFFLHKAHVGAPLNEGDRILETWIRTAHDIPGRPYLPAAFSGLDQLSALQREAYLRFYLRPRYVASRLRRARGRGDLSRLLGGARALVRLLT